VRLVNLAKKALLTAGVDKRPKVEEAPSQTDVCSVQSVGPDEEAQTGTCSINIGERLCKLEQLFEKFVCRKNSVVDLSREIPSSPTLVGSSDKESNFGPLKVTSDSRSNSSIGEGIVSQITHLWCETHTCSLVHKHGLRRPRYALWRIHRTAVSMTVFSGRLSLCYHVRTMQTSSSSLPMGG
jgi:hypothetical protein